jgi:hypothetical protein
MKFVFTDFVILFQGLFMNTGKQITEGKAMNTIVTGVLAAGLASFRNTLTSAVVKPVMYAKVIPLSKTHFLGDVATLKPRSSTPIPAYSNSLRDSPNRKYAMMGIQISRVLRMIVDMDR